MKIGIIMDMKCSLFIANQNYPPGQRQDILYFSYFGGIYFGLANCYQFRAR